MLHYRGFECGAVHALFGARALGHDQAGSEAAVRLVWLARVLVADVHVFYAEPDRG